MFEQANPDFLWKIANPVGILAARVGEVIYHS
jgi:hypothetical protein